ncbi:MAG: S8 family serine peptidase, partial [Rhodothermia bacterium]
MRQKFTSPWLVVTLLLFVTHHAAGQVDLIVKVTDPAGQSGTLLRDAASKMPTPGTVQSRLMDGVVGIAPLFQAGSARRVGKTSPLDGVFRLTLADSATLAIGREVWAARPDIEYAIYNHTYSLDYINPAGDYNDTHFDSLTHLALIRAPEAWEITRGDASVKIGVIDTGVFKEHPDLIGQFWVNSEEDLNGNGILDEPDLNGVDDDGNGYIDDVVGYDFVDRVRAVDQGDYLIRDPDASEDRLSPAAPRRRGFSHGTLVSGVVSAALNNNLGIAGVAPGAKLVPIRAFGIDGLAEDDDVAAAIAYAADTGVDVVNLSFGDSYYSP